VDLLTGKSAEVIVVTGNEPAQIAGWSHQSSEGLNIHRSGIRTTVPPAQKGVSELRVTSPETGTQSV
jgi:hypothetical protein